jgi:hypothetical protein
MGRAMLLLAAHRWPAAVRANLWPYTVRMANDSINNAPQVPTGLSPMERFTQVDVAPRVRHSHTFGCPVYVLDAQLQRVGGQIEKMDGTVTGRAVPWSVTKTFETSRPGAQLVSPQFHVTFDDNFETIHSGSLIPALLWQSKTGFRKNAVTTRQDDGGEAQIPMSEVLFQPSDHQDGLPATVANLGEDDGARRGNNQPVHEASDDYQPVESPDAQPPDEATNPLNQYTTRSGCQTVPTTRWLESQQQQHDDVLALTVTWEVFHDGGYDIQRDLSDPIAFLGSSDTTLTIRDEVMAMAASSSPDVMYMDQALREPDGEQFRKAMVDEVPVLWTTAYLLVRNPEIWTL